MKLAVFDVDGTLIDSQAHIHAAMETAFAAVGRVVPKRADVLAIVGLSLPHAMARLAPDADPDLVDTMVEAYKDSFVTRRRIDGEAASPLYPGVMAALDTLRARDDVLLGVATGKSRRGLDHVLAMHSIGDYFVTRQVADDHPSKPHPAMLLAALSECGCSASDSVMIGDTTFDLDMASAAAVRALAVGWGYHPVAALKEAGYAALAEHPAEMPAQIAALLELSDE